MLELRAREPGYPPPAAVAAALGRGHWQCTLKLVRIPRGKGLTTPRARQNFMSVMSSFSRNEAILVWLRPCRCAFRRTTRRQGSTPRAPGCKPYRPRSTRHAPGSTGHAPGSRRHASGCTGHAPRSSGHAHGSTGRAPGSTGRAPGGTGRAPGSTGCASGSTRRASESPPVSSIVYSGVLPEADRVHREAPRCTELSTPSCTRKHDGCIGKHLGVLN
jgi:hypothetical protein